ncbi:MAG: tetratricopeptide repeat protein [Planctomycetes bacterium]|nr:tetratricopeptide repeat protein [Planctomycetota bacterium]
MKSNVAGFECDRNIITDRRPLVDPEIERLRKKVENYPSPSAYNRLAELLRDNNDPDGVEQICKRSIRDFKRNSNAYLILAHQYLDLGKRPQATDLLENAVQQDPRCVEALNLLVNIYEAKGDPQVAINCLQKILVIKPDDAETNARLAKLAAGVTPATSAAPAPAGRNESGTIDMSAMPTALGTSVGASPAVSADISAGARAAADEAIPFEFTPRTSAPISASSPATAAAPSPAPAPTPVAAPAPAVVSNPLSALLSEAGVLGVVVADDQGRVVSSEKFTDGQDTYFAALAHEVNLSSEEALGFLRQAPMASWAISTDKGQLLAFRRNPALTLLVSASSDCKVAMVELRARQALIDLGGA